MDGRSRHGASSGRGNFDLHLGDGTGRLPAHVVIETLGRRRVFSEARLARPVQQLIEEHELTLGAVLMPDHLHWIVAPSAELDDTVGRFKTASTRASWKRGWGGRLWQRSYFDTPLRSGEILRWTQRYIQANPVRAGLVRRSGEYHWRFVRSGYAGYFQRRSSGPGSARPKRSRMRSE